MDEKTFMEMLVDLLQRSIDITVADFGILNGAKNPEALGEYASNTVDKLWDDMPQEWRDMADYLQGAGIIDMEQLSERITMDYYEEACRKKVVNDIDRVLKRCQYHSKPAVH